MCSHTPSSSVVQSLKELEFERGLWSAACDNDLDRCKDLLKRGHDPNRTDTSGYTPLHYAVRSASENLVKHLLDAGAKKGIDTQTRAGKATALHRACAKERPAIVKLLLGMISLF